MAYFRDFSNSARRIAAPANIMTVVIADDDMDTPTVGP
jgi:hypothetical protein